MASRTTAALPSAMLILRLLTLVLLVASLALIAADKLKVDGDPPQQFTFKDVHAYRYVLAVAVVGCAYTLLHLTFAAVGVARRKRLVGGGGGSGSEDVALLLVVPDVAFALLLAAGAAAGLGFTHDVKRYFDGVVLHRDVDRFFDLAYASAGLMLAAAACTALMIIPSVYSLVKSQ
ncbi:CASP-like protein 4D1 [Panicum virgatum]|uniref:CASP-like protein 4D1 n=1 Tax=Panicum virgatum TaxID=38727 RepID=UPI0019D68E07|nr:CASP-like protein 4D1 [Panicum virgatum]